MPATKAAQDQWFEGVVGRYCDPDRAFGAQCVDLVDDYCIALYGNWINTIRPGNAKDLFGGANPSFFTRVLNNPADQSQVPPRGSILIYGASRAVPEGHTAVVESSDIYGANVVQQDGYLQVPAFRARLSYVLPNGAPLIGWLVPKLEPPRQLATPNQIIDAYHEFFGTERNVEQDAIDHYTRYTIDFVRADLQGSEEYHNLQTRKAQAAILAADAEKRKAAEQAEAQRLAEEQAAADRLKAQAEAQQKAVEQARANATKVSSVPLPAVIPPVVADPAMPASTIARTSSPLVRFLFAFMGAWVATLKKKKA